MRLKPGVDWQQVDQVLWIWLGIIALEHRTWTDEELVITSLRRPDSPWPSRHVVKAGELVGAADLRRHALDRLSAAEVFCRMLQLRWGEYLGVVLEPEWLTASELELRGGALQVDPHVHVQLKRRDLPPI